MIMMVCSQKALPPNISAGSVGNKRASIKDLMDRSKRGANMGNDQKFEKDKNLLWMYP